ncbi:MAG: protein kinase [Gemmatimonadetes bacterium]|nr:protein kinase [Gemmatimonadota bacterium]
MADLPRRLSAALSDRYRIERELGAGGMATVYLAHDLRHDRKVALKVLRPELAAVIGAERFLAEIRTTANLQHPHILPLFDSGEADSFLFYVMPYIDGESLRDRIDREKHLPVAEALKIGVAVASALDYAHRRDVIHRDIKPENILLHDGQPLVADFGIALAVSTAGSSRMTETGMSLGTPTYMSPEQAMGEREIDARADVYSLGCVLYEMLTGDPPFTGSTAQAIAARMLTEVPRSLTTQRHTIPPHVDAAVLTALEKLPADRFPTAQAFAEALENPSCAPALAARGAYGAAPAAGWKATVRNPVVWVLALLALSSSVMAYRARTPGGGGESDQVVTFNLDMPRGYRAVPSDASSGDVAIADDGSAVSFPAIDPQGARKIYVRRLDEPDAHALPGTDVGYIPAFSPDGTSLAFWTAGRIQKASLGGGAPQVVGDYGNLVSLDWTTAGEFIFTVTTSAQIWRVSVEGGDPRPAAPLDSARGETQQLFPVTLPDGVHVLYESWGHGAIEDARVGILDLATGRARRLDLPGTTPLGVLDGRLIYGDASGTIFAVPFDVAAGRVDGTRVNVGTGVGTATRGIAVAALSSTGTLFYQGGMPDATLVLADGSSATPLMPVADVRAYADPRYSPDGKKVAVSISNGASSDVWLEDVASGTLTRLTSGGTVNERPEWSPDGERVLYRTDRAGPGSSAIWWQPADQSGSATPLLADDSTSYFEAVVTPDGRHVVYQQDLGQADVFMRSVERGGAPVPIAVTPALEDQARVSPDGRWVAYVSTASGTPQVIVQPLPDLGAKFPVSVRGGTEPVWSPDSRRIFYRTEGKFRVAEVSGTPAFHVVSRTDFMEDTYVPSILPHANYDVAPDGKKLLVLKGDRQKLLVVHDWGAEVRAKLAQAQGGGR